MHFTSVVSISVVSYRKITLISIFPSIMKMNTRHFIEYFTGDTLKTLVTLHFRHLRTLVKSHNSRRCNSGKA